MACAEGSRLYNPLLTLLNMAYIPTMVVHPLLWMTLFLLVDEQDYPPLSILVFLLLASFMGIWYMETRHPALIGKYEEAEEEGALLLGEEQLYAPMVER